jgi:hypothetical protein
VKTYLITFPSYLYRTAVQTVIELPSHVSVKMVERIINHRVRVNKECPFFHEMIDESIFPRRLGRSLNYLLHQDLVGINL